MKRVLFIAVLLVCTLALGRAYAEDVILNKDLTWYGSNAAELTKMVQLYGNKSPRYNPSNPPVAVFDWDNTVIKNDIGDATVFWMIARNKIKQPVDRDWRRTSSLLTEDAVSALKSACDSQGAPLSPLITSQRNKASRACADEIATIYDKGTTKSGAAAWKPGAHNDTMEPAYAWAVQLEAGYTPDEIRKFARKTIEFNLGNDIGTTQPIGNKSDYNAYLRIYPQIKDLIAVLKANGFNVWVVTASGQYIVEEFAKEVGIDAQHVAGVKSLLDSEGKITSFFEECGTHARGNQTLITYRQGKRCWINKSIFGVANAKQMMNNRSPVIFVAGDSNTDLFMLKDAKYRLVLNRNKTELMCNAYAGAANNHSSKDGKWLINPMFIKPKSQFKEGYDCKKYKLPNQTDTVF